MSGELALSPALLVTICVTLGKVLSLPVSSYVNKGFYSSNFKKLYWFPTMCGCLDASATAGPKQSKSMCFHSKDKRSNEKKEQTNNKSTYQTAATSDTKQWNGESLPHVGWYEIEWPVNLSEGIWYLSWVLSGQKKPISLMNICGKKNCMRNKRYKIPKPTDASKFPPPLRFWFYCCVIMAIDGVTFH